MPFRSPLHTRLTRLRADLSTGAVPANASPHLVRTAQVWEGIDRVALEPVPKDNIERLCALVSDCAGGMVQTRMGLAAVLETLSTAHGSDLQRIDRALAGFSGLDNLDFFRACFLALSTEADRVREGGDLVPRQIARKIADAIEQNVREDIYAGLDRDWVGFVFSRTPLPEGLRMVRPLRDNLTSFLKDLHAKGDPEELFRTAPTRESADAVVQIREKEPLRAWMDTIPETGIKDNARSVLVAALVEVDRLEEAFEYLEEVRSDGVRVTAAQGGLEACLAQRREEDARVFLSRLPPGDATLKGRVAIVRAGLYQTGELKAAAGEMECIQEEVVLDCGGDLRDWQMLLAGEPALSITYGTLRNLADGWSAVFFAQLQLGEFWDALKTTQRVHHHRRQAELLWNVFIAVQRKLMPADAIRVAREAVRIAEESNCREHEIWVVSSAAEFLAREGSKASFDAALALVAEKFEAADAYVSEYHAQNVLKVFVSCPPCDLDLEGTAAMAQKILKPDERATCMRAVALHAALEGNWEQSGRLMRRAKRVLQKTLPEKGKKSFTNERASDEDVKPGVPEFLRWLRSGAKAVQGDADVAFWFSEAFALAQSLGECQLEAVYGVARLLIDTAPFCGQTELYQRILEQMHAPSEYARGVPVYMSELKRRIDEARWSPALEALDKVHCSIEENPPSMDDVSIKLSSSPHPRLIQKHFGKLLNSMRVERIPTSRCFLSSFLETAAQRVLHPKDKRVVDALFEAASGMTWNGSLGAFACLMHVHAMKHGDTPDARMVAVEARAFAERTQALAEYEKLLSEEMPSAGGGPREKGGVKIEQRIRELDFEAAFALATAQSGITRQHCATELFEKALAIGDRELFLRVFELAEAVFCSSCSHQEQSLPVQYAIPWFELLGRFPHVPERRQLLGRIWDWFSLLEFSEREEMVAHWAGKMAAAGQTERALQEVENLKSADRRAHGFMEIALACGLARGEARALVIFGLFLDAFNRTVGVESSPFGSCLALQRACMEFAKAGAHGRLLEIIEEGKKLFCGKCDFFHTRFALGIMLGALAEAGRTDQWGSLLDAVLLSGKLSGWTWFEFSYLLDAVTGHQPSLQQNFTQQQRLVFLEKLFEMARMAKVSLKTTEASVLQVCLQGAEDTWQLIHRFEELSDCSPDVVTGMLKRDPLRPELWLDSPEIPAEPMLRWIASLCPYSDVAAVVFVEHVSARFLQQNDWAALKALAGGCSVIDLSWIEKLADAVLETGRSETNAHGPRRSP